jgi:hypothetical protein
MSPKKEATEYGPKTGEMTASDLAELASDLRELASAVEKESKRLGKADLPIRLPIGNYYRATTKLRFWVGSHLAPAVSRAIAMAELS